MLMATFNARTDLSDRYCDRAKRVHRRLEHYIETEDQDSVHDLRTAIRRLQAAYSAIPPSARNPSSDHYMDAWKKFFKSTSAPRDCDVIRSKLLGEGLPNSDPIITLLEERRKSQLRATRDPANSLAALKRPCRLEITSDAAIAGLNRALDRRVEEFLKYLALVLSDSSSRDNIHELRKAAKKLFYLFELISSSVDSVRMIQLKRLQKMTGEICDCNIAIEFLNECGVTSKALPELIDKEVARRNWLSEEMRTFLAQVNWKVLLTRRG